MQVIKEDCDWVRKGMTISTKGHSFWENNNHFFRGIKTVSSYQRKEQNHCHDCFTSLIWLKEMLDLLNGWTITYHLLLTQNDICLPLHSSFILRGKLAIYFLVLLSSIIVIMLINSSWKVEGKRGHYSLAEAEGRGES